MALPWLRPARATTLQATACKAAQQPRTRRQRLNRVRSALTERVKDVEAEKLNVHKSLVQKPSGQLRNLGSSSPWSRPAVKASNTARRAGRALKLKGDDDPRF